MDEQQQGLTFEVYLNDLPDARRSEVERVWQMVRESVPEGYVEAISAKFLTFMAGRESFIALANQKNYISLYMMPLYVFPELKIKLDLAGKKLKCGKSCINFLRADELPLETIAGIIADCPDAETYAAQVRQLRQSCKE